MDPHRRRALQRLTVELCRDMNPEDMKRALFSKQLLTADELDRIDLPVNTRYVECFSLLLLLLVDHTAFFS